MYRAPLPSSYSHFFWPYSPSSSSSCRSYLCESLVTVARLKEKSSLLLESLAASLASAFSPYEVVSASARRQCSGALLQVSSLARQGYLLGEFNTSQMVADLVSEFTVLNENTVSNVTTQAIYPINTAVSKSQAHEQILIRVLIYLNTHTYCYCDMHIFIHSPPLIPPFLTYCLLSSYPPPTYPLVILPILLHSLLTSFSPSLYFHIIDYVGECLGEGCRDRHGSRGNPREACDP